MVALLGIDFSGIIDWLKDFGIWIINEFIAALGSMISYVVSALPSMPSLPSLGLTGTALDFFNYGSYFFPITYVITVLIPLIVTLWVAWRVFAIALRWGKAIPADD